MSGSPKFKIYDCNGDYMAATKEAEAAAVLVSWYGDGATIRYEHGPVIWREGAEGAPATDSLDGTSETVWSRINARRQLRFAKEEQARRTHAMRVAVEDSTRLVVDTADFDFVWIKPSSASRGEE